MTSSTMLHTTNSMNRYSIASRVKVKGEKGERKGEGGRGRERESYMCTYCGTCLNRDVVPLPSRTCHNLQMQKLMIHISLSTGASAQR